jgi:zinc/manganese transport system substrate-binding protein
MRNMFGAAAFAALLAVVAPANAEAGLKVFACVPEWGVLAKAIGGDAVEVTTAISPVDSPETIRPTPALIADLQAADLLVCTGAGLEDEWLDPLLDRAANAAVMPGQPGNFLASKFATLIEDEAHHHNNDHAGQDAETGGNPHIHGDPGNVIKVAAQLAKRMIELDPENKAAYSDHARTFIGDLGAAKKELEAQAEPLRGIAVAVQHDHSRYLIAWLGIRSVVTIEPEHFVQPGPARLAEIIDSVPRQDIKIIVYGVFDDPAPSRFVGEKSSIPVVMLPYTVGGTPAATDFIGFYRDSVERLLSGLNGVGRS